MVMSHQRTPRLKPFLERVVRGVYRRPLPHSDQAGRPLVRAETDWQLPLLSIQWIMGHDVHLGGLSALGFHGLAHYLPLGGGERVYLYGEVPSWLARLPGKTRFVVRSRVLFGDDLAGVENAEHRSARAGEGRKTAPGLPDLCARDASACGWGRGREPCGNAMRS